jgi:hypothetical protein
MAWCSEHNCPENVCAEHRHTLTGEVEIKNVRIYMDGVLIREFNEDKPASRDLQLARIGALSYIPAIMVNDEIRAELDEWSEIGFTLLECGCLWSIEDAGDPEFVAEHEGCHGGKLAAW